MTNTTPHLNPCQSYYLQLCAFLYKTQRWQDTWNTARSSYGIAMNGRTPLKKLRDAKAMASDHVLSFPVLLMEDVVKSIGPLR